ncbi:hypothetical protein [Neolewinella sp.]|uniref:hypothetical protein n=1 Tax=Neolewinella sp. TaxID=2993543 RepID=UPI003B51F192
MKYFTLLLWSLLFVACAGNNDATTVDENRVESEDRDMTDPDPTATVASTLESAEMHGGDLTALPLDMAIENIGIWINRLRGKEGTEPVIRDLESLQSALSTGTIDGAAVSALLRSLAEETRKVAGNKEDAGRLVEALEAGARRLEGTDQ